MSPGTAGSKDTPNTYALDRFVKTNDPLANHKAFLKMLTPDEIRLLGRFLVQLKDDTSGALTEAEYEQLAIIRFWLDRYDAWAASPREDGKSKTPSDIPSSTAEVARRYRSMLIEALERERDRSEKKSDRLELVKRFALELEKDGERIIIEGKREKIIDVKSEEITPDVDRGEAQKSA